MDHDELISEVEVPRQTKQRKVFAAQSDAHCG